MLNFLFSRKRPKPLVSFVVAGTQKGGTTSLNRYLRKHPDLLMARRKEVHFFDNEEHDWKSGNYDAYHAEFKSNPQGKLMGEATPIYMYWNGAAARIHKYNPRMKFVISLRDPVDRAYSHWNMQRDKNKEKLPFSKALLAEERRALKVKPLQSKAYSYLDRGFYARQLVALWDVFPREQTLVIKSTDLLNSPVETLGKVSEFLEIREFSNVEPQIVHARSYVSSITPRERMFLKTRLAPDVRQLEKLLDWDCSDWLK
jgi:hypothetical protein